MQKLLEIIQTSTMDARISVNLQARRLAAVVFGKFVTPEVILLKPGQPLSPTAEQGRAYRRAPGCVIVSVCIYSFGQVKNPPNTHPAPLLFTALILYVGTLLCLSECVDVCLFSLEPAVALFQPENIRLYCIFSPLRVQLTCQ